MQMYLQSLLGREYSVIGNDRTNEHRTVSARALNAEGSDFTLCHVRERA